MLFVGWFWFGLVLIFIQHFKKTKEIENEGLGICKRRNWREQTPSFNVVAVLLICHDRSTRRHPLSDSLQPMTETSTP